MITVNVEQVVLVFLVFCRIGGFFLVMPGFSSSRVPSQVRLFLAFGITLALAPFAIVELKKFVKFPLADSTLLVLAVSELVIGMAMAIGTRLLLLALQFFVSFIGLAIGMGGLPGVPIESSEPLPSIASFISISAVVMFFVSDLHLEVVRGLLLSYSTFPTGIALDPGLFLEQLSGGLSGSYFLLLRLSAPFVIYALAINYAFGLLNKLTPQIPIYFISMPFLIAGGFGLLFLVADNILVNFNAAIKNSLLGARSPL
ncbi:MAG: flagellar biosynthetic protein FliR [Hyphomicrobiaceae bacterium]